MGQKQKTEEKERKKVRLNDGNNNGQATHGARKPPGPKTSGSIFSVFKIYCIVVNIVDDNLEV